jgi:hypothetical protein
MPLWGGVACAHEQQASGHGGCNTCGGMRAQTLERGFARMIS